MGQLAPSVHRAVHAVMAELGRLDPGNTTLAFARSVLDTPDARPGRGRPPGGLAQARRVRRAEKDADAIRAAELYESGLPLVETAKAIGRSPGFVTGALQRQGIKARKAGGTRPDLERVERIRAMRAEHPPRTLDEIGAALRITRERVRQICVQHDIPHAPPEQHLSARQLQAVQEYLGGNSLERVAAKYDVGAYALRNWILRAGFVPRGPGGQPIAGSKPVEHSVETKQRARLVADLYREGRSLDEIAAAAGLKAPEMAYRLLAIEGVVPDRRRAGAQ